MPHYSDFTDTPVEHEDLELKKLYFFLPGAGERTGAAIINTEQAKKTLPANYTFYEILPEQVIKYSIGGKKQKSKKAKK
jgi:hypothetical protein